MRIYVQSVDYELWRIIVKGLKTPTKKVEEINVPKPESEWNEDDLKMLQSNAKAMNILYCALEVTHECTNQVKEYKINILVHNYELFKMKSDEFVTECTNQALPILLLA